MGGTLRARDAAQTLRWLEPVLKRCGVTRIARVTGLDHVGISVSMAVRPLARTLSVSQGKGISVELADASAAMESVELWHSENASAAVVVGSFTELAEQGHPVVDPVGLRPAGVFPGALDLRRRSTGWLDAESLVSSRRHLVPRYLSAIATDEVLLEHLAILTNTTGLAGGNTLDEATCHALCEVIERDATARFDALDASEQAAREILLESVTGPAAKLLERLAEAGIGVRLWDQTSAVGVPAFGCTIQSNGELRGLGRFAGYGAHLDAEIAVSRAVSEAVQSRLTIIAGARDDLPPTTYAAMQLSTADALPASEATRRFEPTAAHTGSFAGDVRWLIERLTTAGFTEVLRVDLTRPELGVPVVIVFVPGARMVLD